MIWLAQLGKIEKPQVRDYRDARKLFCLPLIPQFDEKIMDDDLKKCIEEFWLQVAHQIVGLERTGMVTQVFVESITKDGKSGLDMVKQLSQQLYGIVKEKIDRGAELVVVESEEILAEFLDWAVCLSVIRKSPKVFSKVLEFQQDVGDRRNKEIARRIGDSLKKCDSGLLVMTDESRLQIQSNLPSDIEVFLIHPPAFNDIMRGFREYLKKQSQT